MSTLRKIYIVLCMLFFQPAYAEEKILSFVSDITINRDASADVRETIIAVTEQQVIRHGIIRSLTNAPQYKIDNISVNVNGYESPYHLQTSNHQIDIYVGSGSILLQPGTYTNVIQYHIDNVVEFQQQSDVFYWNITGNNWQFPIDHAQAIIHLPPEAAITNQQGYTGIRGDRRHNDSTSAIGTPNEISFTTTRALTSGEGLTIAIAWQKGIVTPSVQPSQTSYQQNSYQSDTTETTGQHILYLLKIKWGAMIALDLTLLLVCYYLYVWANEAAEPARGTIIPLFEPPSTLSPEAMRFISEMGFDDKTFSTAVISMACSGFLSITANKGSFTLKKISTDTSKLSQAETALARVLFCDADEIFLDDTIHDTIQSAKQTLKHSLREEFESAYFVTHFGYFASGVFLSFIAMLFLFTTAPDMNDLENVLIIFLFLIAFFSRRFIAFIHALIDTIESFSFRSLGSAILNLVICIPAFVIGFLLLFGTQPAPAFSCWLFVIIITINIIFYHLLKNHTPNGRKLMDQIEGFKLFLVTTEKDRLNLLNPPKMTPELYEKYLPYALALNVENEWTQQFNEVLVQAGMTPEQYHPAWYYGTYSGFNFANVLNTSLASSLASSAITPSSGGGFGGGFSGGGGGGGGGGGW
jgi:uncharacterized membrane protein